MKNIKYLSFFLLFILCFRLEADEPKFRYTKTSPAGQELLQNSKTLGPGSIPVPRFALTNKSNTFILALGGFIQPVTGMDIGNTLSGNMYFSPAAITNVPALKGQKADFFINPLNSAIDLQVIGFANTSKQLTGYVKFDFSGGNGNKTASLSAVYVKFYGFMGGYNHSIFTDVYSLPKTISWSGVTGNSWSKSYQISYNSPACKGFSYGVSIEQPSYINGDYKYEGKDFPEYDDNEVIAKATQPVPDIPVYIQYKWKEKNHIRLSAVFRNFNYVNKISDKLSNTFGAGVQLSSALRVVNPLTLYLQAIYGKGIGHYINGIQYLPISFLPDDAKPGKIKATGMLGCIAG
ncbi:MAG: porin, partial [Bacteroidales bacterium]